MTLSTTVVRDNPAGRLIDLLERQGEVKALSLHQPYASLVGLGAKRFETRSWRTHYRGTIVIHASKLWNEEVRDRCLQAPFFEALTAGGVGVRDLPRGALVAAAEVVTCSRVPSGKARDFFEAVGADARERLFGDWSPGRWAWQIDQVVLLREPIPLRGAQGMFDVHPNVVELVREQLQAAS